MVGMETWNRIVSIYTTLMDSRGVQFGQYPGSAMSSN